jgi:cobyrinic acid a,c-diamide synthase
MRGLVISAPSSGSGKTTVTLGLLAALRRRGLPVVSAKSGPDYIDPAFHEAATGAPCTTLDAWAAGADQLRARAVRQRGSHLLVEGAMGLFDGAPEAEHPLGTGSTADVAAALGLPVVLVLDVAGMGQGAAAIAVGLAGFRADVHVAGVILNRLGSARHETMLRGAVETVLPVLGALPRRDDLALPSRHLGLVQAGERADLDAFIGRAADSSAARRIGWRRDAISTRSWPMPPMCMARFRHRSIWRRWGAMSRWRAIPPSASPMRICWTTGGRWGRRYRSSRRWLAKGRGWIRTRCSCPADIPSFMPGCWPRRTGFARAWNVPRGAVR